MNKVIYNNQVFTDDDTAGALKLVDGSYYNENSLCEDELSVDTLSFTVRFTDGFTGWQYGDVVTYYQDSVLYGKYYITNVERLNKVDYRFSCQSGIGLLSDTKHYGGIYTRKKASELISEIIGGKVSYTAHKVFDKIILYGWLPIATRRENLKQVLFATGGCVKKDNNGDIYITTLTVDTPKAIPASRVFDKGKYHYDTPASRAEVVEHQYTKLDSVGIKELYSGEVVGRTFTTPAGYEVSDAGIVTWDEPYHGITFEGCTLLNNEVSVNYAVVSAGINVAIKGKPYVHSKTIIDRQNTGYTGKEKIATVENATLVSAVNSNSTADRVMAYYANPSTLSASIILDGEKTTDNVTLPNIFDETTTGFIQSIDGDFVHSFNRGDIEIRAGYIPPVIQGSRTLVSIAVTTPPAKIVYEAGEVFDRTGMVITATYDDNSTSIVTNYTVSPNAALSKTDSNVTITYHEFDIDASTTQAITVKNLLKRIAISHPPIETSYEVGDTIDVTGMMVSAYYSDGSVKVISDYEYSPSVVSSGMTYFTVSYTDSGTTKTAIQEITVGNVPALVSIAITKAPEKLTYKAGEYFDTEGMIVTATLEDSTTRIVEGYTYSPAGALGKNDTVVTISYTRKGVTKTATQPITITYLSGLSIATPPSKTTYQEGEYFDITGMIVKAIYSDGTNKEVQSYTYSPNTTLSSNVEYITISYTEGGITLTAKQNITVTYVVYDFTNSYVVTEDTTLTLSDIGATHNNIRIICIGGGQGGTKGEDGAAGTGTGTSTASAPQSSQQRDTNYQVSYAGTGGSGGKGSDGGYGGKVFQKDLKLDSLTTPIAVIVGQGGSKNSGNGTATTCTINNTTYTSAVGSMSDSGFTDIFSEVTYATPGIKGIDGGNGKDGVVPTVSNWGYTFSWDYAEYGDNVVFDGVTYTGGNGGQGYANQGTVSDTQYPQRWQYGVASPGGGGAAVGTNVPDLKNGWYTYSGQAGGNATIAGADATVPGCGGAGGHGGGGGGGAGATYASIYGWYKLSSSKQTVSYGPSSGGSGGKGSDGGHGCTGCLIIYYS